MTLAGHVHIYDDGRRPRRFTGNNKLSVDFTDAESNYDATKCAQDMPPMTPPCTSHYTFDLAM